MVSNENYCPIRLLFKEDDNFNAACHALFHADREISLGASLALGHLKDLRAIPYLLRALLTNDQKKAEAVMWALGEIGDESAIPFLKHAFSSNLGKKGAIVALGKIGSKKTANIIFESLNDADESIRALAARALSQLKFNNDGALIDMAKTTLKERITREPSRKIKLMLSVINNRLDKSVQQ